MVSKQAALRVAIPAELREWVDNRLISAHIRIVRAMLLGTLLNVVAICLGLNGEIKPVLLALFSSSLIAASLHRLWLASSADLWYAGSGATLTSGGGFGYAGRPSNGARSFGTSLEASVNVAVTDRWSIEGFAGHLRGGLVVVPTFRGRSLWFGYLETILRLDR